MITVRPFNDTWNTGFIIEGHAHYAQPGQDIVCSAVSVLGQASIMGLKRYTPLWHKIRPGYIEVEIGNTHSKEVEAIIITFLRGIEAIANQYKENITLTEGDYK